jgi:hypothetical protein
MANLTLNYSTSGKSSRRRIYAALLVAEIALLVLIFYTRQTRPTDQVFMGIPRSSPPADLINWNPEGDLQISRLIVDAYQPQENLDQGWNFLGIKWQRWSGAHIDSIFDKGFSWRGWSLTLAIQTVVFLALLPLAIILLAISYRKIFSGNPKGTG